MSLDAARTLILCLVAVVTGSAMTSAEESRSIPGVRHESGKLIARSRALLTPDEEIRLAERLSGLQVEEAVGADGLVRLSIPTGVDARTFEDALRASGLFEYVEPDWILFPSRVPNDPLFSQQYAHQADFLRSGDAWFRETGSPDVTVAICDTGLRTSHEDLLLFRLEGYNAVDQLWESNGGDISAVNPHGTWVTGAAAANGHNGLGVTGVGWALSHRMLRVTNDPSGSASLWDVTHAVRTASQAGDRVINVSYTGSDTSSARDAAEDVRLDGGVLIWCAGNDNTEMAARDRDDDDLIVVGGTDESDQKWSDSNWGRYVDLVAPASNILTTDSSDDSSYGTVSGTSMSAPLVAGVAGLLWSRFPGLTADEVESILKGSCDDLGVAGPDDLHGYGRLSAGRAVQWFEAHRVEDDPQGLASDLFGYSVDACGDVRVIGAPGDDERGDSAGSFHLLEWFGAGSGWNRTGPLLWDGSQPGDFLGASVATDGGIWLFAGAPFTDGAQGETGSVVVFRYDVSGDVWSFYTELVSSDRADGDEFGTSISVDGDTLVVGAPGHDAAGTDAGAVYVFQRDALEQWLEVQKIVPSGTDAFDRCGSAVAIDGPQLIVGSPLADGGGAADIYLNTNAPTDPWAAEARLQPAEVEFGDGFGEAVAIDWKVALVGASGDDDGGSNAGAAYVYRKLGLTWPLDDKLVAEDARDGDFYGYSVALSLEGSLAAVGAILSNELDSGTVGIHRWSTSGNWGYERTLVSRAGEGLSFFGNAVALDERTVTVGARRADGVETDTGAVDLFDLAGLRFTADPRVAGEGDTVEFVTSGAMAGSLALLALVEIDDQPIFFTILTSRADELGEWTVGGVVPPGLAGVVTAFESYAFEPSGQLTQSRREVVAFR